MDADARTKETTLLVVVGSPKMASLFDEGFGESYQPIWGKYVPASNQSKLEVEGGVTRSSVDNVRAVQRFLRQRVVEVRYRNDLTLFRFEDGRVYVASGFAVGYDGTGSYLLADLCLELGVVRPTVEYPLERTRSRIASLPLTFKGTLFPYTSPEE